MEADVPQVSQLLTITGVSVFTIVVVEVIKRAAQLSEQAVTRWGPLLSVAVATVSAMLALFVINGTAVSGESIMQAVMTGILGGAAASGLYSTARAPGRAE